MTLRESKIGSFDYSCVMAVPSVRDQFTIISALTSRIDPDDIHWGDGNGPELEVHTTVLYGLHTPVVDPVRELLERSEFHVSLTGLSTFGTAPDYDVLKLDVSSPELAAINADLKKQPHTSKFKKYTPHITIAYLKKGCAARYLSGLAPSAGTIARVTIEGFLFSSLDPNVGKVSIPCLSLAQSLLR